VRDLVVGYSGKLFLVISQSSETPHYPPRGFFLDIRANLFFVPATA